MAAGHITHTATPRADHTRVASLPAAAQESFHVEQRIATQLCERLSDHGTNAPQAEGGLGACVEMQHRIVSGYHHHSDRQHVEAVAGIPALPGGPRNPSR